MYTTPKDLKTTNKTGRPSSRPDNNTLYDDWRWMTYTELCGKYGVCYRTMTRWVSDMRRSIHYDQ